MAEPPDFRPRPTVGADFALAGKSALDDRTGPRAWCCSASTICGSLRTKTRGHFLGLMRAQLGKLDGTNPPPLWQKLLGRSMFPPRKYFTNTE